MRKALLLFFLTVSGVSVAVANDYFAWAARFDNLEVGYEFPVVSQSGDTLRDAMAKVEIDKNNPSNKVLHVTTGATAGLVIMSTPNNMQPKSIVNQYQYLYAKVIRDSNDTAAASAEIGIYIGKYSAYKNTGLTDFSVQEWKEYIFTPLKLEKTSITKQMRFGINAAGADYYIDDICFLTSEDAFEKERAAREAAIRDSLAKELEETAVKMIDRNIAYDFEDYELGTEFVVYQIKGTTTIEGAKAVVEEDPLDPSNKVLHVTTPIEGGYVELDNPRNPGATSPMLVTALLEKYPEVNIKFLRSKSDNVTGNANFEIAWGGSYAYNDAPANSVSSSKWVDNTFALSLKKKSLSKKMRIGFVATGADYYIDDITFIDKVAYDIDDLTKTVRYWADKLGKNFGTCVNPGISTGDLFGKTVAKNFNMVVLENAMKFDATEPRRNQFNYNADGVVSFAQNNNMKVRGHTLTWHGQNPDWVADAINAKKTASEKRQEAINILKNHIYNVVGHWKGKIAEWDVVNECLEENVGRAVGAGYTTRSWSVWYTGFGGDDYIDSAFVWAHQADPDAKLYINDYNIGHWGNGHYENGKTHAMYNLAKRLKDAGIPIDGVGMQTHTSVTGLQPDQIEETIKQFQAIGLNCIITEMDMPGGEVQDKKCVREISAEELRIQAQKYAQIADIMLRYDNAPTLLVWGVVDNRSWLDGSEGTKPLLFFADYSPHQAYIDMRKTYQKHAYINDLIAGVDPVFDDDDPEVSDLFEFESKTIDVHDITGRMIATGVTLDYLYELPEGLYFVGGKKFLVTK